MKKHQPLPPPKTTDDYLTRQQVAKRLNLHPQTVKRLQDDGKLTPFVFGANLIRYSASDVETLVQSAKTPSTV